MDAWVGPKTRVPPMASGFLSRKVKKKRKLLTIARKPCEEKLSQNAGEGSEGRTVVVGLKLDSRSRELLTWALVKVAKSGDSVVAIHILDNSEVLSGEGNSSLLSLVKAFDSLLQVYEGFCNLKQVDLKLKICRGSSTRKVLVREAKAYSASIVIVGTSRKHHGIGLLSTSVARHCARKLPKCFCVLAVDNGKVVFRREATGVPRPITASRGVDQDEHSRTSLFGMIRWSMSKNPKVLNDTASGEEIYYHLASDKSLQDSKDSSQTPEQQKCPICSSVSVLLHSHCTKHAQEISDNDDNSLALVPSKIPEVVARSVSLLVQDMPELGLGSHELLHSQQISKRSKEVSLVQWAMRLPTRYCSPLVHPDHQFSTPDQQEDGIPRLDGERGAIVLVGNNPNPNPLASPDREAKDSPTKGYTRELDGESGAIVLVGDDPNPLASPNHDKGRTELDGESGAIVLVGDYAYTSASPDRLSKKLPKKLESFHEQYSSTCRLFSYQELLSATFNFLPDRLIGSGGSSHVYKGCLPDGKELAVKILKPSVDVLEEFVSEVEFLTTLNHKNIVSILGFCFEDNNLLLVYDFLTRGSVEENLHGNKKDKNMFGWGERYKVALGVAEALDYLHNGNAQCVIHRDVKSSNILLSDDFEPQLSDFGLATWASTSTAHITSVDVAGTFGYLAPEYFMYGKLNDKVDVYAFGVVLLELLSGRKPISNEYPKGQESLVMWANPILNGGKTAQLLDPALGDNYDHEQMERMVLAATLCVRRSPGARPGMNLVLKLLIGDTEVTKWSRLQLNAFEDFDALDDESLPSPSFQSHLNLALCDVEDDSLSFSSVEQNISLEDYLQGRWSRTSSFD